MISNIQFIKTFWRPFMLLVNDPDLELLIEKEQDRKVDIHLYNKFIKN